MAVVVCWRFWLELGVSLFPVLYIYGMWYVKILKSIAKAASLLLDPLGFGTPAKDRGKEGWAWGLSMIPTKSLI